MTSCNCEHISHEEGTAHGYMAVPAGRQRAAYVGLVCDDCATGHMAQFLFPEEHKPGCGCWECITDPRDEPCDDRADRINQTH